MPTHDESQDEPFQDDVSRAARKVALSPVAAGIRSSYGLGEQPGDAVTTPAAGAVDGSTEFPDCCLSPAELGEPRHDHG
jgi:hypothetical protein